MNLVEQYKRGLIDKEAYQTEKKRRRAERDNKMKGTEASGTIDDISNLIKGNGAVIRQRIYQISGSQLNELIQTWKKAGIKEKLLGTRELVEQLSEAIDEMDNGRNLNAKNFIRQVMRALLLYL